MLRENHHTSNERTTIRYSTSSSQPNLISIIPTSNTQEESTCTILSPLSEESVLTYHCDGVEWIEDGEQKDVIFAECIHSTSHLVVGTSGNNPIWRPA